MLCGAFVKQWRSGPWAQLNLAVTEADYVDVEPVGKECSSLASESLASESVTSESVTSEWTG
jgi:hypothetical protein